MPENTKKFIENYFSVTNKTIDDTMKNFEDDIDKIRMRVQTHEKNSNLITYYNSDNKK